MWNLNQNLVDNCSNKNLVLFKTKNVKMNKENEKCSEEA